MSRLLFTVAAVVLLATTTTTILVDAQKLRSLLGDVPVIQSTTITCGNSTSASAREMNCHFTIWYASKPVTELSEVAAYSDMCTQLKWDACTDNTQVTDVTCTGNFCSYNVVLRWPLKPVYWKYHISLVRKEQRFHYRVVKPQFMLANITASNKYGGAGQMATVAVSGLVALLVALIL